MKTRSVLVAAAVLALAVGLTACAGSKKAGPARAPGGADIRAARRSSVDFKIFPTRVSSVPCRIPHGGPYAPGKMRLAGTCTTELRTYHPARGINGGHGTAGIVEVAFTERWHWPAGSKRWWRSTYIVLVRRGHVLKRDTRSIGAAPPQSWL